MDEEQHGEGRARATSAVSARGRKCRGRGRDACHRRRQWVWARGGRGTRGVARLHRSGKMQVCSMGVLECRLITPIMWFARKRNHASFAVSLYPPPPSTLRPQNAMAPKRGARTDGPGRGPRVQHRGNPGAGPPQRQARAGGEHRLFGLEPPRDQLSAAVVSPIPDMNIYALKYHTISTYCL